MQDWITGNNVVNNVFAFLTLKVPEPIDMHFMNHQGAKNLLYCSTWKKVNYILDLKVLVQSCFSASSSLTWFLLSVAMARVFINHVFWCRWWRVCDLCCHVLFFGLCLRCWGVVLCVCGSCRTVLDRSVFTGQRGDASDLSWRRFSVCEVDGGIMKRFWCTRCGGWQHAVIGVNKLTIIIQSNGLMEKKRQNEWRRSAERLSVMSLRMNYSLFESEWVHMCRLVCFLKVFLSFFWKTFLDH